MTDAPHEYAIAGSYVEFLEWRREDVPARRRVMFLDRPERAVGQPKGIVHRLGGWRGESAEEDGPYCSSCWDAKRQAVRLHADRRTQWKCPACGKGTHGDGGSVSTVRLQRS